MSSNETFPNNKEPVGPITEAYLQRDVHPDEKTEHRQTKPGEHLFPKNGTEPPHSIEDLWMFR